MSEELFDYTIITHIYGIMIDKDTQSFPIGDFTLCTKQYLLSNYKNVDEVFSDKIINNGNYIAQIDNYFIIMNRIQTSNSDKAKEIFNSYLEDLINIFLYLVPTRRPENSKISIYKERYNNEYYTSSNKGIVFSRGMTDLISPLYIINNTLFTHPGNNIKIIKNITHEPSTQLEKRINRAVSWIGQSLKNKNFLEAFLELCIALETLLLIQDDSLITKSIVAQLSEDAALLIGKNYDDRIIIVNIIKKLYQKRSRVVHTNTVKITEDDYFNLVTYLKLIISAFFTLIDEHQIDSIEKVKIYLDKIKFT